MKGGCNFPMGPLQLLDLVGLDTSLAILEALYAEFKDPNYAPAPLLRRMVSAERLGRKSGEGFYSYEGERHRPEDPDLSIDAPTLDRDDLARIDPAAPRVLPRLVAQIANEAAFALEEEVGSAADMDTAMRLGFNWPLGPIEITELIGARRTVVLLEALRDRLGEAYAPSPRLTEA